jgi:hypothetical protein
VKIILVLGGGGPELITELLMKLKNIKMYEN